MKLLPGIMLFFLLGAGNVSAEMVAVASNRADIRSKPSLLVSTVRFEVPLYYPLSTQDVQGDFYKVTDYMANSGWILKSQVDKTRTVVVSKKRINVRKGPGLRNPIIFAAQDGVTFKVIGENGDWLHVKHESGKTGWLHNSLVWGN